MNLSARDPSPGSTAARSRLIPFVLAGVVWLATMAAFWPAHHFEFIHFDDDINIFLNPHLGEPDGATAAWMLTDFHYMRRYIPAGWAGFSIIYRFSGLDPRGYHIACIFLHGLNVLLLFAICREIILRFLPDCGDSVRTGSTAAVAAAWWAWHPMRVETVAWASGYLYAQAIFFLLLSFYLYITRDRGRFSRAKLWFSAICYLFSLSTYPLALAYPAVLLFFEAAKHRREAGADRQTVWQKLKPRLASLLGWFGTSAVAFGVMTVYAAGSNPKVFGRPVALKALDWTERLGRAGYAWGYYLWKPWWPFRERLVPDAFHDPAWQEKKFWLCLFVLAGMICLCFMVKASRRSGFWAVGAAYLLFLVPTLGLTEKTYFLSDRYSYLASLPLVVGLAVTLAGCRRPLWRRTAALSSMLVLCGLFVLTRKQLYPWKDSRIFFDVALKGFSKANDEKSRIYLMLANTLRMEGDYNQARLVCARGLREFPEFKLLREQEQKIEQTAAAEKNETHILGLKTPVCQLAQDHAWIAAQKIQQKRWREAADHLREALKADPDYYPARFALAEALVMQGKTDEALAAYLRTLTAASGHISHSERTRFLLILTQASASNGQERLAHIALEKAWELMKKRHGDRPVRYGTR